MAAIVDLMWAPAQQWFTTAPQTVQTIKRKLAPATKFIAAGAPCVSHGQPPTFLF